MNRGTLAINTQNILPIIKKWLYSDKDIFLRELISNACDAITKRRMLHEKTQSTWQEPRIDIRVDTEAKTIIVEDNGLGMDEDELTRYLSQVAFSSAEEFMSHYQSASSDQSSIIGHFGLGFYSAFMVASRVEVDSKSYKEDQSAHQWSCDGGVDYIIEPSNKEHVGTLLRLHIDDNSQEYLEISRLETILNQYCRFLPFAIYLNDKKITMYEPLWLKSPRECTQEDYLNFYKSLYPTKEDPIFWIHLDVDYPFNLKGILYFPRFRNDREVSQDAIQLYYNRVFVSAGCKDILPEYLLPLHGAIDSVDLPLNVSRSSLQLDRTVRQLSAHISKKVADALKEIYQNDQTRYEQAWPDMEIIVKWGAMQDEKFYDRVQDLLLWKNDRDSWTNLKNYLEKSQSTHAEKVYYTKSDSLNAPCMKLYKQKEIEVLVANEMIDLPLFAFLEGKQKGLKFLRIDSSLDETLIDVSKEKSLLDENGQTEATRIELLFKKQLSEDSIQVEAKSLSDDSLPVLLIIDEQERRFSDYMTRQSGQSIGYPGQKIIINTNNPLILALSSLEAKEPELAKEVSQEILELARFSHRLLSADQQQKLIDRSWNLLQKIVTKLI
jgi:molecular chaperone HtpG